MRLSDQEAEFLEAQARDVMSKMADSSRSISICSSKGMDGKLALETGAAVLLDKPIIVWIAPGGQISNTLRLIAAAIIEGDLGDPKVKEKMVEALDRVTAGLPPRQEGMANG